MNIRRSYIRMDERSLGLQVLILNNLCNSANIERIEYLISLFNNDSAALDLFEKCFLINYVGKNQVSCVKERDYGLYIDDNGKYLILSKEETDTYTIVEDNHVLETMGFVNNFFREQYPQENENSSNYTVDRIVNDLIQSGFKFLETNDYYLAFCEERNIVFFARTAEELIINYDEITMSFFQQPYISYYGTPWIGRFWRPERCRMEKIDFPLFTDKSFLRLYNSTIDNDTPFISSMKRIAKYPELYEAVGAENRALIDKILSEEIIDGEKSLGQKKR